MDTGPGAPSADGWLDLLAGQEKRFDALYRRAAQTFGLSICAMWVLYFVATRDRAISQQELNAMMMFPKQTINSAVAGLVCEGKVELRPMPAARGRKAVLLTAEGRSFCEATVLRLREAERRAVDAMGEEKLKRFASLYGEFFDCLGREAAGQGIG